MSEPPTNRGPMWGRLSFTLAHDLSGYAQHLAAFLQDFSHPFGWAFNLSSLNYLTARLMRAQLQARERCQSGSQPGLKLACMQLADHSCECILQPYALFRGWARDRPFLA